MTTAAGRVLLVVGLLAYAGACTRRDLTSVPAAPPPAAAARPAAIPDAGRPPPAKLVFPGDSAEATVKNLVLRYNELMAFGYWHLNMNHLQEVATVARAEKAYFHMAALGEGKVRMRSYLRDLAFASTDAAAPGKVVLRTREVWDFAYHDLASGALREEQKGFVYLVTYTAVRQPDGRWLITDVAAVGESEGAPDAGAASRPAPAPGSGSRPAPPR